LGTSIFLPVESSPVTLLPIQFKSQDFKFDYDNLREVDQPSLIPGFLKIKQRQRLNVIVESPRPFSNLELYEDSGRFNVHPSAISSCQ
jgi:hypothetical protein